MNEDTLILVVDDEKYICDLIKEMLADEGYKICEAYDAQQAFKILENQNIDLVLTDLVMGEKSGVDVLNMTLQIQPETVVVMMTGQPTIENAVTVLKSGAYDYLMKPFSLENLKATIKRGLEKKKLIRENIYLKETVSLYRISEAMGSTMKLDHLLNLILRMVIKELGADMASVLLLDERSKRLRPKAFLGISPDLLKNVFLAGTDPVSEWVVKNAKPRIYTPGGTRFFHNEQKTMVKSLISYPLLAKGKVLGTVNLVRTHNPSPFTPSQLQSLSIIASKATSVIESSVLYEDLKEAYLNTLTALANAVEARDLYTRGHTERVWYMAGSLATQMNWGEEKIQEVRMGSILHDIGKIGVPDAILNKKGPLNKQEFEIMKSHTTQGVTILEGIEFLKPAHPYVLYHHERYDGEGYPEGLKGEDIPMEGRLMAVVDTFDAITSERPYRKRRDLLRGVREIKDNSGTQFDPFVVEIFLEAWEKKIIDRKKLVIKSENQKTLVVAKT
ncbi:MAG: HD domain-containing phosphohydrolase [Candidatus Zixiibacteriota bacterium]